MNRGRIGAVVGVSVLGVAAIIAWIWTSEGGYDSTTEALLRNLHRTLLVVAVLLAVVVQAALFYAAIRFHRNDDPKPTEENRRLEITWTVGVAIILLFVGASSYLVLAEPTVSTPSDAEPQPGDVHVEITGQNWFWTVSYPGENVTMRNLLVLPTDRRIFFTFTSTDVVHSVHIPGLGIKQDAFPGQTTAYRTRLTGTGTYRLYCAEFCGSGHSKMDATVRVVEDEEYQSWLRRQRQSGGSQNNSSSASLAGNA